MDEDFYVEMNGKSVVESDEEIRPPYNVMIQLYMFERTGFIINIKSTVKHSKQMNNKYFLHVQESVLQDSTDFVWIIHTNLFSTQ